MNIRSEPLPDAELRGREMRLWVGNFPQRTSFVAVGGKNRLRRQAHLTTAGGAARALAVACGLNLNGVASMAFGVDQIVSIVMLLSSAYLMRKYWRFVWSLPMTLVVATIVTYLMLGTLFYDFRLSIFEPERFYQPYLCGVLIMAAVAGYTASLADESSYRRWLVFVRNVFVLSSLSVWASPLLYKYYVNLPDSAVEERMSGFFGNPNEAAMASLIAVTLLLVQPVRVFTIQVLLLCAGIGAIVLTFSKNGMSCLAVVLALFAARQLKGYTLLVVPILATLGLLIIQDAQGFIGPIIENPVLELNQEQKNRLFAIGNILSGQINEQTTTQRSVLWHVVIARAWDVFPLGSGIGSANNVIGGIIQKDQWLGVHNTFLMLWGEAGILPPLLLISALVTLILRSIRRRLIVVQVGLFILVADMMSYHGALTLRYHNLLFGLLIGATSLRVRRTRLERPEPSHSGFAR